MRVVVVLRMFVLAFVPHRWHIAVREAGWTPLQGGPFPDEETENMNNKCHDLKNRLTTE